MTPKELDDKNLLFIKDIKTETGNYARIYKNKISGSILLQYNDDEAIRIPYDMFKTLGLMMINELLKDTI